MVVISLRGGIDGLGVVVPHGDPAYYAARPTTAVAKSALLCADSMFGLHPSMAPLEPLWNSGELAAVQATGLRGGQPLALLRDRGGRGRRTRLRGPERLDQPDDRPRPPQRHPGRRPAGDELPDHGTVGPNPTLATQDLNGLLIPGIDGRPTQRYGSLQTVWGAATGPLASGAREAVAISKGPGQVLKTMAASTACVSDRVERNPVRRTAEERRPADPRRHRHRRDRHRRRQLGPAHRLRHPPVGQACRATSPASRRRWPRS